MMKLNELTATHVLLHVPPSDQMPRESYYIRALVNERHRVHGGLQTSHVTYRLKKLEKAGLVKSVNTGYYMKQKSWKCTAAGDAAVAKFGKTVHGAYSNSQAATGKNTNTTGETYHG